jgi:hypothetical protein
MRRRREGRANIFVAVEHANSEVVGIHASRSANRFEALEPVRQGVHRCFGAIAPGVARGLKLRHDHGSNYMSGDFQDEIECLGIESLAATCTLGTAPRLRVICSLMPPAFEIFHQRVEIAGPDVDRWRWRLLSGARPRRTFSQRTASPS